MAHILAIFPYSRFIPPLNGGQLRCYYLLREMARTNTVDMVCLQPRSEIEKTAETSSFKLPATVTLWPVDEYPPPPFLFDRLPRRLGSGLTYRWLRRRLSGPTNVNFIKSWHAIRTCIRENPPDLVFFKDLNAMLAAPYVSRLIPAVPCTLDAHNVDHQLIADEACSSNDNLRGRTRNRRLAYKLESSLVEHVDACFACSEKDRVVFARLNRPELRTYVIPNGVDVWKHPFDASDHGKQRTGIIFCGALNTVANRDGLLWFHSEIWPRILERLPHLTLNVVGVGGESCEYDPLRRDTSVNFVGTVPDVDPWYAQSFVSVVPLRVGSGTRLKALEAMSLGTPVVSTAKGVEGIDYEAGTHLLLADGEDSFADAVVKICSLPDLFDSIRHKARLFVENNYSWEVIGEALNSAIAETLAIGKRTR